MTRTPETHPTCINRLKHLLNIVKRNSLKVTLRDIEISRLQTLITRDRKDIQHEAQVQQQIAANKRTKSKKS